MLTLSGRVTRNAQRNKNYRSKKIYRIDHKSLSHRYIVCSKVNHSVFHHLAANKEFPLTYTMSKCLIVDAPYLQMLLRGQKHTTATVISLGVMSAL